MKMYEECYNDHLFLHCVFNYIISTEDKTMCESAEDGKLPAAEMLDIAKHMMGACNAVLSCWNPQLWTFVCVYLGQCERHFPY